MPESRSAKRARRVSAGLHRFGEVQGIAAEQALKEEVVEAFVVKGLSGTCASSTRGTYRSVLRQLGGSDRPSRATPFAGSGARPPYTTQERTELVGIARVQRANWRRDSALVFLALGIGTGLRAGEIASVIGNDVVTGPGGVSVRVGGSTPRTVKVRAGYGRFLSERGREAKRAYLFHPGGADRSYPNFINDFARNLTTDPGAPKLCYSRCRSSFICDHLESMTKLAVLLEQAGICEVESLLRYARYVCSAPQSKAALREQMRRQ